jgi:prefoldin subunit 5
MASLYDVGGVQMIYDGDDAELLVTQLRNMKLEHQLHLKNRSKLQQQIHELASLLNEQDQVIHDFQLQAQCDALRIADLEAQLAASDLNKVNQPNNNNTAMFFVQADCHHHNMAINDIDTITDSSTVIN